jgi:5-methylcytosine-specific restriction endonuclease McrA
MFNDEKEPLSMLIEVTPRLAKKRYRQSIYEAWNHCCGYCGKPATSLDHIIPRFKSGSSNRNNLVPSCQRCNSNKGSCNMEEWYRKQKYFCEERLERIKDWMDVSYISCSIQSYNVNNLSPDPEAA